jgi:DNA-binding NtrC family response regulator
MCAQVLLVEDDAKLCDILRYALRDAGHDVRAFCSSNEALEAIGPLDAIDLLIADPSFPAGQTNGVSLSLAATVHHRMLPVIYLTESNPAAAAAREAGHSVLLKPFTIIRFIETVQDLLEARRSAALAAFSSASRKQDCSTRAPHPPFLRLGKALHNDPWEFR